MRILFRVLTTAALISIPILYSSCGNGDGGTGPDTQPAETLASFELTVPDSISEGEAFTLAVTAVGNRGTKPLTSYSGTVSLSTTLGTVNPSSLTVSTGTGSGQVTLSTPGQQTLTASGGGRTGSVGVDVTDLPEPLIEGDPAQPLEQAVQDSAFSPRAGDYSNDHPDLPGMYLSHNTVLLVFHLGTTVEDANSLLMPLGAELLGAMKGISGEAESVLVVRLATANHQELESAMAALRADPQVLEVVQDGLLGTHATPPSDHARPGSWSWMNSQPGGPNDNLKLVRAPQMWNLNGALKKQDRGTFTGIIDVGFGTHEDLAFQTFGAPRDHFHGIAVAGIIAAKYQNDIGIEGINPFSDADYSSGGLVAASVPAVAGTGGLVHPLESVGALMVSSLGGLQLSRPDVRVINISLGYNWFENGVDPTLQASMDLATRQGRAVAQIPWRAGQAPLVVVSAGNDHGLDARYGSPFANAALEHQTPNILVVESGYWDGTDLARLAESNVGGNLLAPGLAVFSTTEGLAAYSDITGTESHTGTSFAAAFVSGLAGYLLAADPDLGAVELKQILWLNGTNTGFGAAKGMDAWASVMGIDDLQGNDKILRMMVDIDDGTLDGNQRVDYDDSPDFPDLDEDDADGDGGIGDGGLHEWNVDMSDFRVWRDWYLKLNKSGEAEFDGRVDHPKMDVNGDGQTDDETRESVFPRGDFNGDGKLSIEEEDKAFVPGAINDEVSDLDVMKAVFDDPFYEKDELDTLVLSSDVTVDASIAFDVYTSSPVKAEMWQRGMNTLAQEFELTADEPRKVFTVRSRPGGYWLEVRIGSESRFADNGWRVLATTPGTDAVMWPIKPIPVNEKSTFLNSCDDPGATTAQAIPLESLRVEPGEFLYLEAAYDTPRVYESVAVFSASDEIKVETEEIPVGGGEPPFILVKRTVTDAIPVGANLIWGNSFSSPPTKKCGGVLTNIPQDFHLLEGAFLKIPDGATHLFLGMASDYYDDNGEGDVRVRTSKWYAPEWHDMHEPSPVR